MRSACDAHESDSLLTMDLTDHDSIRQAVRSVVDNEGAIDVLINNAGMHTGGAV